MRQIYEIHREQHSVRRIARELGIARNTVREYLREPGIPKPRPRPPRSLKLDPFRGYL